MTTGYTVFVNAVDESFGAVREFETNIEATTWANEQLHKFNSANSATDVHVQVIIFPGRFELVTEPYPYWKLARPS